MLILTNVNQHLVTPMPPVTILMAHSIVPVTMVTMAMALSALTSTSVPTTNTNVLPLNHVKTPLVVTSALAVKATLV